MLTLFSTDLTHITSGTMDLKIDKWIEQVYNMVGIEGDLRVSIMTTVSMACWMLWKESCNVVFKRKVPYSMTCIININSALAEILQVRVHNKMKPRMLDRMFVRYGLSLFQSE